MSDLVVGGVCTEQSPPVCLAIMLSSLASLLHTVEVSDTYTFTYTCTHIIGCCCLTSLNVCTGTSLSLSSSPLPHNISFLFLVTHKHYVILILGYSLNNVTGQGLDELSVRLFLPLEWCVTINKNYLFGGIEL